MAYWRSAGLTYLTYLSTATSVLRAAVKEPLRAQLAQREVVNLKVAEWAGGKGGSKVHVADYLPPARKHLPAEAVKAAEAAPAGGGAAH